MSEVVIPEPYAVFEDIDLEMAKVLYALNRPHEIGTEGTNRKVRSEDVKKLAAEMLAGKLLPTNQGLGISVDDELVDGQHRLLAFLLAAETNPDLVVKMLVVWNLPPEAKLVVDIGAKRRPGDFLGMQGIGNGNKVAAALRILHCYDHIPYDYMTWKRFTMSPMDLVALLKEYPNVEDAYEMGRGVMRITSPSSITTILTIIMRDRPDLVEHLPRFLEPLKTGAGLGVRSPILALRNWSLNASEKKKSTNGIMLLGLLMRSFNHWVEDSKAGHLVFREADMFPTLTKKEFYPR